MLYTLWPQPLVRPRGSGRETSGQCSGSVAGSALRGAAHPGEAAPEFSRARKGGAGAACLPFPLWKAVTHVCGGDLNGVLWKRQLKGSSWCPCPLGGSWRLEAAHPPANPPASTQTRPSTFSSLVPSKGGRPVPWGQRGQGIPPQGGHLLGPGSSGSASL